MRNRIVIVSVALVAGVSGNSASAAPGIVKCQSAIFGSARNYLKHRLSGLASCTNDAFKCVQTVSDAAKRTDCFNKAGANCLKKFAGLEKAKAQLVAGIADLGKCGGLGPSELFSADRLGFDAIKEACAAQYATALTDATQLAKCIVEQYACQADALFGVQQPRALELMALAGIPEAASATAFRCLQHNGGSGEHLEALEPAKQLVKCVKARAKDATTSIDKAYTALSRCELKILTCEEGDPTKRATCLAKLTAFGACDKARTKIAALRTGAPQQCTAKSLAATSFDTLRMPSGGNHLAVDCQCSAVDKDRIETLADDQECIVRQGECRLSEMMSVAAPRSPDLLASIGQTAEDFVCPPLPKSRAFARDAGANGIGDVVHHITEPGPGGDTVYPPNGGTAELGTGSRKLRTLRARRRVLPDSASALVIGLDQNTKKLRVAARELRSGRLLDGFFDIPIFAGQEGKDITLVAHFPETLGAACFDLDLASIDDDGEVGSPVVLQQGEVPPAPSTAVVHLVQVEQQDVKDDPAGVAATGLEGVRWVAISADGTSAYVTSASDEIGLCNKPADPTLPFCSKDSECPADGGPCTRVQKSTPDGLVVFDRDTVTGRLSFVEGKFEGVDEVHGVTNPLGVAVSLDSQFVYLASEGLPAEQGVVSMFKRDAATHLLTQQQVIKRTDLGITGIRGARSIVISPDSKHVYVAGTDESPTSSAIALFNRDNNVGTLTFVARIKNGDAGTQGLGNVQHLAISGDGKNVYAAALDDNAVTVFARNSGDGSLSFVEMQQDDAVACVDFEHTPAGLIGLCGARNVVLSPDDKFLYVSSGRGHNDIAVFARDPGTGKLTFVEVQRDSAGGLEGFRPTASVVSVDGRYLFVAGGTGPDVNGDGPDRTVTVFARNATTGRLTFVRNAGGSHVTDGVGVAVDRDNKNVYLTGERTNTVAVFEILPTT